LASSFFFGLLAMHEHLARYLNDHLAGSVAALELIEHLHAQSRRSEQKQFLQELRQEIVADRDELNLLMERLHISASRPRQAMAWLAERASELKLHADDEGDGALVWFESLEILSLGIEGKRLLWLALAAAAADSAPIAGVDYGRLARRAQEQRERVDALRLDAARAALAR
jgi:hypothetical protein